MESHLDAFAFRCNRRKTVGVCRIATRLIEAVVVNPLITMRILADVTKPCRRFASSS
jgi:hypothetical protein